MEVWGQLCMLILFLILKKKNKDENPVYLGPSFKNSEIFEIIKSYKNLENFKINKFDDEEVYKITAKILENKVVGWFKGRMEWVQEHWEIDQF